MENVTNTINSGKDSTSINYNNNNNNNNNTSNWVWSDKKLSYYDKSTGWYYREDLGYFYFDENNECHYVYPTSFEMNNNVDNNKSNNNINNNYFNLVNSKIYKDKSNEHKREKERKCEKEKKRNDINKGEGDKEKIEKVGNEKAEDHKSNDNETGSELEEGEITEDEDEIENNNFDSYLQCQQQQQQQQSNIYLNQNNSYYSNTINGIANEYYTNGNATIIPTEIQLAYGMDGITRSGNNDISSTQLYQDTVYDYYDYENEYLRLVVQSSNIYEKGSIILIDTEGLSIGRDRSYEKRLRLPEMQVSKYHAKIYLEAEYHEIIVSAPTNTSSYNNNLSLLQEQQGQGEINQNSYKSSKPYLKRKYKDYDDQSLDEEFNYSYNMYDDNNDDNNNNDKIKKDSSPNSKKTKVDTLKDTKINIKDYKVDNCNNKNNTKGVKDIKMREETENIEKLKKEDIDKGEVKNKNKELNNNYDKIEIKEKIENRDQRIKKDDKNKKPQEDEEKEGIIKENDNEEGKIYKDKGKDKKEEEEKEKEDIIKEDDIEENEENDYKYGDKDEKDEKEEEKEEGEIIDDDDSDYTDIEGDKRKESNKNYNNSPYYLYKYNYDNGNKNFKLQPQPQPQPQPQYTCTYHFSIIDMGSTHGTFVNGERLSETKICSKPCPLKNKDIIQIGSTILEVHYHKNWACSECTITENHKEIPLLYNNDKKGQGHGHNNINGLSSSNGYDPNPISLEEQRKNELKRLKNKYLSHSKKSKKMKYDTQEKGEKEDNHYIDRAAQRRELYSSNIPYF